MFTDQVTRILLQIEKVSNVKRYLPTAVSSLRFVVLPLLIASLYGGQVFLAWMIFIGAITTDILDGRLARKFRVTSEFGAWFDATADFVFICGTIIEFTREGLYPAWLLILIIFMFVQFIITSKFKKLIYDPVGKYYGTLLFGVIGLTILFPQPIICLIVLFTTVGVTSVSIGSRFLFFLKNHYKILTYK